MRFNEFNDSQPGEYRIPTIRTPERTVGNWYLPAEDEKISPGVDSDTVKENPWMKNDPYISDMALMQKMNSLNGHYSGLMAQYSPYNPQSPYAGLLGRNLYKKYGEVIKQMVMAGKTGKDVAKYLQDLTGGKIRQDIIQLLLGNDPNN